MTKQMPKNVAVANSSSDLDENTICCSCCGIIPDETSQDVFLSNENSCPDSSHNNEEISSEPDTDPCDNMQSEEEKQEEEEQEEEEAKAIDLLFQNMDLSPFGSRDSITLLSLERRRRTVGNSAA